MSWLAISILFNLIFLSSIFIQEKRHKAELEAQKPVLNLEAFEDVYDQGVLEFGKKNAECVAKTCIRTAMRLGVFSRVEVDLLSDGGLYSVLIRGSVEAIKSMHQMFKERVQLIKSRGYSNEERLAKVKEMYDHIIPLK